jgi:ABC-type nitrate/sulfonate/bicarbonate transport system substrate-binding protein
MLSAMRKFVIRFMPLLLLPIATLIACSVPPFAIPVPTSAPASLAAKSGIIRVNISGSQNVTDVPFLMAMDLLRKQGYSVELTPIARFDLVTTALAKGDLDFAHTSDQIAWAAIAKGAPIVTLMSRNSDTYLIAANQDITNCGDLNGKRVALSTTTGAVPAMLDQYLASNCPGASPDIVTMTGDRYPGLISGNLDAALLELDDWLELERQAPGRFHSLINFAAEYPQLDITAYHVRRDFAAAQPETVKDFLRAILTVHRQIQDKQVLEDAIVSIAQLERTRAKTAVETYLAQNVWDVNGGLTDQRVQFTLNFMIKAGALPSSLRADQVADLSYLSAVLSEIGSK